MKTSLKIAELAYEYAFIRQPTFELSGSFGVHYMDVSIKLSGDAIVTDSNGNSIAVSGSTKKGDVSAPLPVIGIRAGWVVAPNVYLDAQGQYFKANVSGYDGSVTDLRAGATWMFTPEPRPRHRLQPLLHQREDRKEQLRRPPQVRLLGLPDVPDRSLLSGAKSRAAVTGAHTPILSRTRDTGLHEGVHVRHRRRPDRRLLLVSTVAALEVGYRVGIRIKERTDEPSARTST